MSKKANKFKRANIYFRQTAAAFRAARQTQIFSHIRRNITFKIYQFSKRQFVLNLRRLQNGYMKIKTKLPKQAKRIKIPKT